MMSQAFDCLLKYVEHVQMRNNSDPGASTERLNMFNTRDFNDLGTELAFLIAVCVDRFAEIAVPTTAQGYYHLWVCTPLGCDFGFQWRVQ
jgi:hypothetical protein